MNGPAVVETLIFDLARRPETGVLATDVADRVHKAPVPDSMDYPFLTFARIPGTASRDTGPLGRTFRTVASQISYEVKGVDTGYDTLRIDAAAECMDAVLDGGNYQVILGTVLYDVTVIRTSDLQAELAPDEDGTVFQQSGAIYEFTVARIS